MPNGAYRARLAVSLFSQSEIEKKIDFVDLGTIQVNGSHTVHLAIPAFSNVSGTVTWTGPAPQYASVHGWDDTNQAEPTFRGSSQMGPSSASVGPDGRYSLYLMHGRTHKLSISFPWNNGWPRFSVPGKQLAVDGDRVENFTVPALPEAVTISGRVTNAQGQGVEQVEVFAESEEIGSAGLGFSTTTRTDSNGNYTFSAPKGTNYRLTFTPLSARPSQ